MTSQVLLTALVALGAGALTLSAQIQPRGKGLPPAIVPPGVKALRDLAYIENGHERQKLDLYLPEKSDRPLPLIVWVHGGGWQAGSKDQCFALRHGFVEHGYALASIGYRLSSHAPFPAQIQDCKAALRWLRAHAKEYNLDADHFGVWGSSAGGHLVALLGTSGEVKDFDVGANLNFSSRVQAVCDYYGPTDLLKFVATPRYESHAKADSPESKLLGGTVAEVPDKAKRANPITYVSKDDPPFIIFHGSEDPVVPPNQSESLQAALQAAGVPSQHHVIPGARHGGPEFSTPEVIAQVTAFFDRHLRGLQTSASPIKAIAQATVQVAPAVPTPTSGPASSAKKFELNGEHWTYQDGAFKMSGILLQPEGKGPFPGVLISHGLGGSAGSFGLNKAREFVKWGLVCIAPDYTHSAAVMGGGRPGAGGFPKGGKGMSMPANVGASEENLRRARVCFEILQTLPQVDTNRFAAYGHSMGGFVTIGLAAHAPTLLKAAAVTGSGVAPRAGFPAPSVDAADKIRTPFLMLHGAADLVVRPDQSASLKTVLDRNHIPNDRRLFEAIGHPIDQEKREEVYALIREWFTKHGVLKTGAAN